MKFLQGRMKMRILQPIKIAVGDKFNRLVFEKFIGINHNRQKLGKFKCECGSSIVRPIHVVIAKKSKTKSCGCMHKNKMMTNIMKIGDRFGNLILKSFINDSDGLFLCDCGKEKNIRMYYIYRAKKNGRSCGCKKYMGNNEAASSIIYRTYLTNAIKRGYKFELDFQYFKDVIKQDCYYCGAAPINQHINKTYKQVFLYNGIDRLDNNLGYSPSNCVTCCGRCNKAKMDVGKQEFIDMCKKIANRF